jgi:hypothetical protein
LSQALANLKKVLLGKFCSFFSTVIFTTTTPIPPTEEPQDVSTSNSTFAQRILEIDDENQKQLNLLGELDP